MPISRPQNSPSLHRGMTPDGSPTVRRGNNTPSKPSKGKGGRRHSGCKGGCK